jgi:glycosyltransferase involved in cell wall biosynthesis
MTTRPLRIVHTMSSLEGGGMEHFVVRLADAQRRRGHDASILALQGGPLQQQAERLGVPVRVLGGARTVPRLLKGALRAALLHPDIVHAHNPTSVHYGVLFKLMSASRLVVTDHRGILRVPTAFEWLLTDAVIAVSCDTARRSTAASHIDVQVIYNGITPVPPKRTRAEVRAELGLGEQPVALHVGNFLPVKAHDILVDALAALRDRGVPLTLLTAGQGPELEPIRARAKAHGLGDDRVRFLGYRSDVPDLLAASDIFVLPSRMEGVPLAVLEAMSHRLPIVTTRVGGLPEIVGEGEQGFLVPPEDVPALADALGKLALDPALRARMGESARARSLAEFSFDEMTNKYDALYARLLGR